MKTPPNILEWTEGKRHPNTPIQVFQNVRDYDHVRRILIARCGICKATISRDEKAVKELVFVCEDISCDCKKMYGAISHRVCSLCYDLFHALYANYGMKNRNYFKEMNDRERAELNDPKRRDRLGL